MAAPATVINEQNPWPWLDPFDEEATRFFNGRSEDAATLLRMVRGSSVTVLFGKSGLGKTSLLQAGLFPALRQERLLPVYVRLRYDEAAGSLQEQLWNAFVAECKKHEFSYREASLEASRFNTDSLWLYLHHRPLGLVANGGPPWQPVFVLDQFEEVFTLGGLGSTLHEKLFSELGDLLESRIPRSVADRIEEDDDLLDTHDLDTQPYRFLVSLREDYLPDLELWSDQIPRLGPNRYRLLPMGRTQALQAIVKTGGSLVAEISANRIVDYMSRNDNTATALPQKRGRRSSDVQVEPALLSLVCSGLNAKRIAVKANQLDTENLVQLGGEIIEGFYDERLVPMPAPVRRLIERELITPDGVRIQYPVQSAVAQGEVLQEHINRLVGQRILRIETIGDSQRVELVHDRLAAVALKRRREAELHEAAEQQKVEQEEAAQRLRRKNTAVSVVAVFLLAIAAGMFWLYGQAETQRKDAADKSAALEVKTKELETTLKNLKESQQEAETSAKEAQTKAKEAERESQRAQTAEQAANTALIQATSVRLAAEGQAIVSQLLPGNSFQGVLKVLASHRTLPGVEAYFATQSAARALAPVKLLIGNNGPVLSVAFSPDGKRIASGSDNGTLQLWDAETGRAFGEPKPGHARWVQSIAFSPDSKRIVSGSSDGTLRLWDATRGEPIGEPLHTSPVLSVAFSPDGKRIVSGGYFATFQLWDAATRKPIGQPVKIGCCAVQSAAFSPDGKQILSGSGDDTLGLWDADTGKAIGEKFRGHTDSVRSAAFSADGKRIVSGGDDKTVRLWDALSGKAIGEPLRGHTANVRSVAFSAADRIASASDDNTVRLWDAATGKPIGEPLRGHNDMVSSVKFSSDGERLVSGSYDNTLRLWNLATLRGEPFSGPVFSVAFSPDGKRIASGGDTTLRLWDAATGKPIGEPIRGHTNTVLSVAFSPDGKRIASGGDTTLRLWDAVTGKPIGEPLRGHTLSLWSVTFSPDGKRILSGADTTLRLWDAVTGKPIGEPLRGHKKEVRTVAFSADGKWIVSGGDDNSVRLWEAATGKAVGEPLHGHRGGVLSAAFSPDGKRVVSGSKESGLRVWDVLDAWANELCTKLPRNMTQNEWKKWVGELPYRRQCPNLPGPPDEFVLNKQKAITKK